VESKDVRRAKKAALFLKEISSLFYQAAQDNPELKDLYPSRVKFSPDMGMCTIYFYSPHGREFFEQKKKTLILFKPSLRTAVAGQISMRRVPDFFFHYDDEYEKHQKVDDLISKLKAEGKF
jgi:ribosome-binding factor A